MGWVTFGTTVCRLCGETILDDEDVQVLADFTGDECDPLFSFSDRVFHASCFVRHPDAQRVLERERLFLSRDRTCVVCGGGEIGGDPRVDFWYYTDDPSSPLYRLQYRAIHVSHAPQIAQLAEAYSHLLELRSVGRVCGNDVERVLDVFWTAMHPDVPRPDRKFEPEDTPHVL